jgi:hypothetical protein
MKTYTKFKIPGIIAMVLGIIHICATPIILKGFANLNKSQRLPFTFIFICAGIAVGFVGWLQYYLAKQADWEHKSIIILKASIIFMLVFGIGAVLSMHDNVFAYICLLVAFYESYLIIAK